MYKYFRAYLLPIFLLTALFVKGQKELGSPYIKNFNTKKHKVTSSIWDITQDKKGLMYFGTGSGVLQFDGSFWHTIKIDNGSTARSLDVDSTGTIFVGGKGEFGYLGTDSLGLTTYVSLSKNLAEKHKDFSDIWNIYVTDEGVFFFSFQRVFQWKNNQFKIYEYNDITAHLGFYVNKKLYLVRQKKGLHVFKNDAFVPVPGGEHYIGKTMFSILPYDDNNVIVATRKKGLEKHNIYTGEITPFSNSVNEELKQNKIYHGAMSEKGEYMIATLANGIYVIDKNGKLITNINQSNGLQSSNVKYLFKDFYGSVWAGTAMGVSYIDLNLPITYFDSESGVKGHSTAITSYKDEIYLTTGNGVYYLDTNTTNPNEKFKLLKGADEQFWGFLKIKDKLYVSARGLYEVKEKNIRKVWSAGRAALFDMKQSKINPELVYFALKDGMAVATTDDKGEIISVERLKGLNDECKEIMEDKNGDVWVKTGYNYILKINAASFIKGNEVSLTKFEQENGLAAESFIKYKNEILFSSEKGLQAYSEDKGFYPYKGLKISLDSTYKIKGMIEDENGGLWIHYHNSEGISGDIYAKPKGNSYVFLKEPFTRIKEKVDHIKSPYIDKGVAWYFGGENVVRYDFSSNSTIPKNYHVNIRQVALNSDSVIDYGSTIDPKQFVFNFNNNATSFTFSAATYSNEEEVYYQYFLEGHDEKWSEWTTQNNKEYNFLHEGKYVFKVRAKNVYNHISEEDQFSFEILPPWYRETWAYIVYTFLILLLIYVIIRIATHRLQQSKKQLELIVEERTKDIIKEKEKVEHQKLLIENVHAELSERNKDVMDSIKYAKRIQSSILPPIEKIKNEFEESFVLYKPRDIVSGDFYWYEKVGDFFIAACADCTGHGVPGAFMSMIGATLLNKIVEKENISHCQDALNLLDQEVVKTLQQTSIKENEIVMDGMDISLIAVNKKTKECHYAGAYRPLYLIRNNELKIYKANRQSIGGSVNKEAPFVGENIELQSGDVLYMFTDGVTDQFGGEKNKKYKTERLKQLLLNICDQHMEDQSKVINKEFEKWKGDNEQIDDVLIMGIKIP